MWQYFLGSQDQTITLAPATVSAVVRAPAFSVPTGQSVSMAAVAVNAVPVRPQLTATALGNATLPAVATTSIVVAPRFDRSLPLTPTVVTAIVAAPRLMIAGVVNLPPVATTAIVVAPILTRPSDLIFGNFFAPSVYAQVVNPRLITAISQVIPPVAATAVVRAPSLVVTTTQVSLSPATCAATVRAPTLGFLTGVTFFPQPARATTTVLVPPWLTAAASVSQPVPAVGVTVTIPPVILQTLRRFPMAEMAVWTFQDIIDQLWDQAGQDPRGQGLRDVKRAILSAYRDLPNTHQWSCLYRHGRFTTEAPYLSGAVAYTHSSRTLTLTGGTWPTWAARGVVVIDERRYEAAERVNGSLIKLAANSNPGADLASGTRYQLYLDEYDLPDDFAAADYFFNLQTAFELDYVPAGKIASYPWCEWQPGTPRSYTIMGSRETSVKLKCRLSPPPDQSLLYEFIYRRVPRPLTLDTYEAGTISGALNSTTVNGVGTSWQSSMTGGILRIGDSTRAPTGREGTNPFRAQRRILGVSDATTLILERELEETVTNSKYTISDPIDLDPSVMLTAFLRRCEYEYANVRNRKDKGERLQGYREAVLSAMEADSRLFGSRVAGNLLPSGVRLVDMKA